MTVNPQQRGRPFVHCNGGASWRGVFNERGRWEKSCVHRPYPIRHSWSDNQPPEAGREKAGWRETRAEWG